MRLAKGIAALFILLLICGASVSTVSAERDSLKVIIIAEDKIYRVDDTIMVEVRVYNKAELTDADEIMVTLDTIWQVQDMEVELSQISTGIYQGTYQIQDNDHHAWFNVYAEKGTDNDGASLNIDLYQDHLELDLHFAHQNHAYLWSGESVTATITSRYRGDLIDVDDFSFLRLIYPSDEIIDLNGTIVSQGTYQVTCSIPEVNDNGNYELEARATYAGEHAEVHAYITVNVLSVWYHFESLAGNTATFTLGVADENGDGVANAEVSITQPYELTTTTGEDGTVIINMMGVYNGIPVRGEVSGNGKNQSFEGRIYTTDTDETPNPDHRAFDVIYEGEEFIYKSGSSISRSYKAYNCTIPLQNQVIYYYITLEGVDMDIDEGTLFPEGGEHIDGAAQIVTTGTATTNQLGEFSLSFKAPSDQGFVYITFESGIPKHDFNYRHPSLLSYDHDDELVYEEDYDVVFVSKGDLWEAERVSIESEPLVVGGKTKITVETSDSLGHGDELIAKWMSGIPTSGQYIDELESDWVCWVEGTNMIFLEKSDDNKYTGHSVIPDFMSKEGDYTLVAGYVDDDTGYPYVNKAELKEGERALGQGDELLTLLLLFAAVSLVLIALAFGAFVTERGGKGKGDSNPPLGGGDSPPGGLPPSEPPFSEHAQSALEPESPSDRLSASTKFPWENDSTSSDHPAGSREEIEGLQKAKDAGGGEGK
jgi:hypothetical protein